MKYPLVLYFVATFGISWLLWITGATLARTDSLALRAWFFLPGTFTPALVALWLTSRTEGRAGLRSMLKRVFHWEVAARWYALAIGYMVIAKLIAAVLYRLVEGVWPAFGTTPLVLMLGAVIMSTPFQAGEEIGWRGYALPRLASRMGWAYASLFVGVAWAAWHLPLFYIAGTDLTGQPFPVFLVSVTAVSVAMAYLYAGTRGSLLLVLLMHAAINNTTGIVPASSTGALDPLAFTANSLAWLTAGVLWVGAVYFLYRMRGLSDSTRMYDRIATS